MPLSHTLNLTVTPATSVFETSDLILHIFSKVSVPQLFILMQINTCCKNIVDNEMLWETEILDKEGLKKSIAKLPSEYRLDVVFGKTSIACAYVSFIQLILDRNKPEGVGSNFIGHQDQGLAKLVMLFMLNIVTENDIIQLIGSSQSFNWFLGYNSYLIRKLCPQLKKYAIIIDRNIQFCILREDKRPKKLDERVKYYLGMLQSSFHPDFSILHYSFIIRVLMRQVILDETNDYNLLSSCMTGFKELTDVWLKQYSRGNRDIGSVARQYSMANYDDFPKPRSDQIMTTTMVFLDKHGDEESRHNMTHLVDRDDCAIFLNSNLTLDIAVEMLTANGGAEHAEQRVAARVETPPRSRPSSVPLSLTLQLAAKSLTTWLEKACCR